MNKRIKEIAVKAKLEHCVSHVRLQEFAELLVEECCSAIKSTDRHRSDYFIAKLREHFENGDSKTGVGNNLEG